MTKGVKHFCRVKLDYTLTVLSIPLTNSIIPTHITWATDQPVPPLSKLNKIFKIKIFMKIILLSINLDIV